MKKEEKKQIEKIEEIVTNQPKKKRKTKLILILLALLAFCCIVLAGSVAFAWYGGHIQKAVCDSVEVDSKLWNDLECEKKYDSPKPTVAVDEPQETPDTDVDVTDEPKDVVADEEIEVIDIKLEDKIIQIEISKLINQDKFIKDLEGDNVIQMYNNPKSYGSTGQYLTYFYNERAMTNYFANNDRKLPFEVVEYPLEKGFLGSDVPIYYLDKYLADDDDFQGGGIFYAWEPTTDVHGFEASSIINYFNIENVEDIDFDPTVSRITSTACVFALSNIDEQEYGYLTFDGYASAGSEINYCSMLKNLEVFEISIIKDN